MTTASGHGAHPTTWPHDVQTLSIDIGGTGLKAAVLDPHGQMVEDRVRVETPYPCPPHTLVESLHDLVSGFSGYHRASVGFPGLVRGGCVIEVPSLSRAVYGGPPDPALVSRWHGFDLAHALAQVLHVPVKVANDADVQGCAVAQGKGMEFVMTLGTGVGTALFNEGHLLPHLELSHGPFRKGESFDIQLGNASRKKVGNERWARRVRKAIDAFHEMLYFDHIYIGGGNAKHLTVADLGHDATIVPNTAGIIGGVRIWELDI
ncbi:MAG: ROK family protein [Candidatus Nanopelagicales bacterium]